MIQLVNIYTSFLLRMEHETRDLVFQNHQSLSEIIKHLIQQLPEYQLIPDYDKGTQCEMQIKPLAKQIEIMREVLENIRKS